LGRLDDLARAVAAGDPARASTAADALAALGASAVPDIERALAASPDPRLRRTLITVLARVGGREAIDSLTRLRGTAESGEVDAALLALSGQAGAAGLSDPDLRRRDSGQRAAQDRVAALESLDPRAPGTVDACRGALDSGDPLAVKAVAVRKLEEAGTDEAIAVLRKAVLGPGSTVQGQEDVRLATPNPEPQTPNRLRVMALAALVRLKTNAARGAVREALESGDEGLVRSACDLLGAFGDAPALPLLEQLEARAAPEPVKAAAKRARAQIGLRAAGR
jgi:HEAT repeat protein